jgi:hypothetical protein
MFVHFRETPYGLAMSLVETRRENGKVRHEHVASLGSIETPLSVAARIEFWRGLHERLDQLSNRLDAETRGKVIGAVHARVPMVTPDEQRALQLEKAKGVPGNGHRFLDPPRWPCPQEKHNNRAAEITQPPHRAAVGDNGCSRLWRQLERANDFAKASRSAATQRADAAASTGGKSPVR